MTPQPPPARAIADAPTLAALIERLEKAAAGSRELDAEIMFDLYAKPVGKKEDGGPSGYLWPEDNASWSFGIRFPGKDRAWFERQRREREETLLIERDGALVLMNSLRVPRLTTSIDAALALVPEGYQWDVRHTEFAQPRPSAFVWPPGQRSGNAEAAASPALALCIAALRARGARP